MNVLIIFLAGAGGGGGAGAVCVTLPALSKSAKLTLWMFKSGGQVHVQVVPSHRIEVNKETSAGLPAATDSPNTWLWKHGTVGKRWPTVDMTFGISLLHLQSVHEQFVRPVPFLVLFCGSGNGTSTSPKACPSTAGKARGWGGKHSHGPLSNLRPDPQGWGCYFPTVFSGGRTIFPSWQHMSKDNLL